MTPAQTARQRREQRRAYWSGFLHEAFAGAQVSQALVGRLVGARKQQVQKWTDTEEPSQVQLPDVEAMPKAVGLALLRELAHRMGYEVIARPRGGGMENSAPALLVHVMRESSESTEALAAALADGELSNEELRRIHKEAEEASRAHAALGRHAEAEMSRRMT
ncbi:MAG: phage regulatory CII family protein [Myxococcota bacterium]